MALISLIHQDIVNIIFAIIMSAIVQINFILILRQFQAIQQHKDPAEAFRYSALDRFTDEELERRLEGRG
jgi:hypothetical protein